MNDVRIEITSSSLQEFTRNLRRKQAEVREVANVELEAIVRQIFAKAQQRVPVVTGALAVSGQISSDNSDDVVQRVISYGNSTRNPVTNQPTAEYAVDRHESYNPAKPESYKWLERTMSEESDAYVQAIARALRSRLEG